MNDFIWSPILIEVLVSGLGWVFTSFLRKVRCLSLLWLDLVRLVSEHGLRCTLYMMRIDDLVLLLNIKRFKLSLSLSSLLGVVPSVLTLIVGMDTLWIMVPYYFINHLPPTWSTHKMLIILDYIPLDFTSRKFVELSTSS